MNLDERTRMKEGMMWKSKKDIGNYVWFIRDAQTGSVVGHNKVGSLFSQWMLIVSSISLFQRNCFVDLTLAMDQPTAWSVAHACAAMPFLKSPLFTAYLCSLILSLRLHPVSPMYTGMESRTQPHSFVHLVQGSSQSLSGGCGMIWTPFSPLGLCNHALSSHLAHGCRVGKATWACSLLPLPYLYCQFVLITTVSLSYVEQTDIVQPF